MTDKWVIIKDLKEGYIVEDCCGETHFTLKEVYHKYHDRKYTK
jgi:hypothetical protein